MEIRTLSQNEQAAYGGATHIVKVDRFDLTAAATTQTLPILPAVGNLPAGTIVECIGHRVVTAFAGPSITAVTLQVGDGGDTDRLCTAALDDLIAVGFTAVPRSVTTQPFCLAAADAVDALFTATGANLSVLTAGEVHILLRATPFITW
jgi:hypothetical protein